jgi:hypothetical protein
MLPLKKTATDLMIVDHQIMDAMKIPEAKVVGVMPPRPLGVSLGWSVRSLLGAGLFALAGLGAGIAFIAWAISSGIEIRNDQRLWQSGKADDGVQVEGKDTSRQFIAHEYKLTVRYRTQEGAELETKIEFDTLGAIDHKQEPALRYDPSDPKRIALSWAIEASSQRWLWVIFIAIVGPLIGAGFGVVGRGFARRWRVTRTIAAGSEEVIGEVTFINEQRQYGRVVNRTYQFAYVGPDDVERKGSQVFPAGQEPLTLGPEPGGRYVVILVAKHAPDRPLIVERRLRPFVVAADEVMRAQERAAQRSI